MIGHCARAFVASLLLLTAGLLDVEEAAATRLFATYAGPLGPARDSLFEIDASTGEARLIAGLPNRVWSDLSGRTGDNSNVYAVTRIAGSEFLNTLSTISIETGSVLDLATWTATDLGLPEELSIELLGIDIAAAAPGVATISVGAFDLNDLQAPSQSFLFDFDFSARSISPLRAISGEPNLVTDLTSNLAGEILGLAVLPSDSNAVNLTVVDRSTSVATAIGRTLACGCRAIDFDPTTGNLYGVDGFGNLRILAPDSAEEIEFIGATGLGFDGEPASTTGLAFVVPEPTTSMLLGFGLAMLAGCRRQGATAHAA